jgi:hypothetical protein
MVKREAQKSTSANILGRMEYMFTQCAAVSLVPLFSMPHLRKNMMKQLSC